MKSIILTMLVLLVVATLNGQNQVAKIVPGIQMENNFIPLDSLKDEFGRTISGVRKKCLEASQILRINGAGGNINFGFKIERDSVTNIILIDSLFANSSHKQSGYRQWRLNKKNLNKVIELLHESIRDDSPVIWNKEEIGEKLGYRWKKNVTYTTLISHKSPYSIKTTSESRPYSADSNFLTILSFSLIILFIIEFIVIINIYIKLDKNEPPEGQPNR